MAAANLFWGGFEILVSLALFAVAVDEGFSIHGFFAFGLETIDGDKITVGTFDHKGGADATCNRRVADDGGSFDGMSLEDDAGLAKELVFRLRETLVGDNLTEDFFGRVFVWAQKRLVFGEFGGESGFGIVLGGGSEAANLG